MENAAEALKMAADFLVFIIALGISISSFSQAKTTAQTLLNYTDREYEQQYVQESTTDRIVGKETILPTLYRAYKENYKIIFYDGNNPETAQPVALYRKKDGAGNTTDVTVLDLQEQVLGTDLDKENFMMALLYGNKAQMKDSKNKTLSYSDYKKNLDNNGSRIEFLSNIGICDTILKEGNTFIEKFGVYYQDDIQNTNTDSNNNSDIDNNNNDTTPDANKQQKRVISYYLHSGKINV